VPPWNVDDIYEIFRYSRGNLRQYERERERERERENATALLERVRVGQAVPRDAGPGWNCTYIY
jgi:hypothetical protein